MSNATERLVNLALLLASTRTPVSAETIRAEVFGYPEEQDEDTFLRMFERDKKQLRACGLALEVTDIEGVPAYRLDAGATYARDCEIDESERAALRAVAAALASDPGFPFGNDLAIAIVKLGGGAGGAGTAGGLADEAPAAQGAIASDLAEAVAAHKRARFGYTNAAGEPRTHDVEPYGVFFRDGRWYLVGRDTARNDMRVYAVRRMRDVAVNSRQPRSADFEVPGGFSVAEYMLLPFQYGPVPIDCVLRFSAENAWRAPRLTGAQGVFEPQEDGGVLWRVVAHDLPRLTRWIVENGPGITPISPPELRVTLAEGLQKVVARHDA
ncbi:MAG: WYL domain-containing protein [Coriobacteriia bacterium]|nr:WYL domain-containing protein [Coriobacteriia bacterium]